MKLSVAEIFEAVHGTIYSDRESWARVCQGFTWDSRKVTPGCLFIALPGERVDGNDFIVQAICAGAGCVIATKPQAPSVEAIAGEFACPVITVEDGQAAVGALAAFWRSRLHSLVVGVTGSTGKTSTKDLLKAVLSQRYKVHATEGNHNNELGVPYTILTAPEDCELLIVEMGMRGLGQIEDLCKIVQPNIGVVTNVGLCHMELLGSQENIARAKGELLASLPETGLAVVNGDDPFTDFMIEEAGLGQRKVLVMRFGQSPSCDTKVSGLSFDEAACASFTLQVGLGAPFEARLSLPGKHNVSNALSACCVGSYLGVTADKMAAGLASAGASGMRMETVSAAGGFTLVNDAYNANPDSTKAALESLAAMACSARRIAVLGDMGELGPSQEQLHSFVGHVAAKAGIDWLVCVGPLSRNTAQGALGEGMDPQAVTWVEDVDQAIDLLKDNLNAGDLVLVKASRFMGMERVVEELRN